MVHTSPHSHDHGHRHAPADFNRAFAIGVALNVIYIVVEATYGVLAGSLAFQEENYPENLSSG